MPELPEVETIRKQLLSVYQGELITRIEVQKVRIFQNIMPEEFAASLTGKRIMDIKRYGKFCIFNCEDFYPVFHLGMSGAFLKDGKESVYPQHIHIQFYFSSGKELSFQDVRKFGKVWLFKVPPQFPALGLDPTTRKFTLNNLKKLLNLKQMNIKFLLMNQSLIAGIGNIYANEILFNAGISPLRKSNNLTKEEISSLYASIKMVLNEATKKFGTTYTTYRTVSGEPGRNQNFLKVYHRGDQTCFQCGSAIKKIVMGSRSTFYCPTCQK